MREFGYLKLIEKYQKQYDAFPLPVIICDRTFLVYWSNRYARRNAAALAAPATLQELVGAHDSGKIWASLEHSGSFQLEVPLHSPSIACFLPVPDSSGAVTGAVVLFVEHTGTDPASQMAGTLGKHLRRNVGGIFQAMDEMAAKADLLRTGWIQGGLNEIGMHGYRLLRAADNLTAYARYRVGREPLTATTFDLAQYLEEISDAVSEIGRTAGIPVVFDLPQTVCPVHVELAAFELALFNLAHNSLYFTKPGNAVHFTARREQGAVRLTVRDKGIGIPADRLSAVWSPYTAFPGQGEAVGLGLGLAVVRQAAKAVGMRAELQSISGEGTVATLLLPTASISQPLQLRQETSRKELDNRFSRLYIGLTDAVDSPHRER